MNDPHGISDLRTIPPGDLKTRMLALGEAARLASRAVARASTVAGSSGSASSAA